LNTKAIRFFFHKIVHWEYWPQAFIYAPLAPVYTYFAAKAGTPFFNVAANPDMENGGYLMESKFTIHKQLPQHLVPDTVFVDVTADFDTVNNRLLQSGISYPFFCKPDIGGKGRGVEKVESMEQLGAYHQNAPINYLIQAAIPYKNEIGVFYCRLPGEAEGFITGIVGKAAMELKGDGVKTFRELIAAVPRYYYHRSFLFSRYAAELDRVLAQGEVFLLSEIGNHARGSMFTDLTAFNNRKLEEVIDSISKSYNTLYYGRYDIKFNSWEELYEGRNFMIVELNGSGSEPTHIYDPAKSIWQAWKIIVQHWKLMYKIAAAHHKNGVPYLSFKDGRKLQRMENVIAAKFKMQEKMSENMPLKSVKQMKMKDVLQLVTK
jgi:hypothetical protein